MGVPPPSKHCWVPYASQEFPAGQEHSLFSVRSVGFRQQRSPFGPVSVKPSPSLSIPSLHCGRPPASHTLSLFTS